jgi:hypothetical protein
MVAIKLDPMALTLIESRRAHSPNDYRIAQGISGNLGY